MANLKSNFLNIKSKVDNRKVLAVVKADAYGHGMVECVRALNDLKNEAPDYYAVALFEEALELKEAKVTDKPVLTFSPFNLEELEEYLKYEIMPTVCVPEHIEILKSLDLDRKLSVHVNIDSGMGRLGYHYSEAIEKITELAAIKNVEIAGVYTHFATSDDADKEYANIQLDRFKNVTDTLKKNGVEIGIVHAANSGAILDMPEAYFDMVRCGMILYGYYPSEETSESIELKPVMSLVTQVTSLRKVAKGESVSYGRKFIAEEDSTVFTAPIGYADGVNRNLTNKINCLVKGKKFRQVGRVTMDRILFLCNDHEVKGGRKRFYWVKAKK